MTNAVPRMTRNRVNQTQAKSGVPWGLIQKPLKKAPHCIFGMRSWPVAGLFIPNTKSAAVSRTMTPTTM